MERNGRLVRSSTGWKCRTCGFVSPLELEDVAEAVHQAVSPRCLLDSPLDETQRTATVADLWPPPRQSDDMMVCDARQRTSASRPHPNTFPQPHGRSEDEGSADSGQQLESDDVVYHRGSPRDSVRRKAPDQQLIPSRIEDAKGILSRLRCAVCYEKWRSTATTQCRHFGCCENCFQETKLQANPEPNPTCVVCRETVQINFKVEFHSSTLLEGLDIPFPLPIGKNELQDFIDMGFPESKIRRAIRLIQLENNTTAMPDSNSVLDLLVSNTSSVPTLEQMELLLDHKSVNDAVKNRLCDYLEEIVKCMACRHKSPNMCLLPCRHLALCRECFVRPPRPQNCPDCGKQIENQVEVYLP